MTPTAVGIICFGVCLFVVAVVLPAAYEKERRDDWFDLGWDACMAAHNRFEMSAEDDIVLKEQKKALWAYVKANQMQKPGDKKRLDLINDFQTLNAFVWEVCVYRRGRNNEDNQKKQG